MAGRSPPRAASRADVSRADVSRADASWLDRPLPRPDARLRLLCVPYAGAGSEVFRPWVDLLPPTVELCAVRLPGRGTRMREPPCTRVEPLVAALADALPPADGRPLALFGHSMGALLAFELARELRRRGLPEPPRLLLSGLPAPQLPPRWPPASALSDEEFLTRIREFGGTPDEVLRHDELMQVFLPVLRADFALLESYAYREESPLGCALSVFGGADDPRAAREQLEAWRAQSLGPFLLRTYPGGHFFLNAMRPTLVQAIVQDLQPLLH